MADLDGKNLGNVIGGYKAALHNPKVGEEAKEHAKEMIHELGGDVPPTGHGAATGHAARSPAHESKELDMEGKNPGNVVGGYKATLSNPNVGEEAKEHAKEMVGELGGEVPRTGHGSTPRPANRHLDYENKELDLDGKNVGNVIGGYKAALHNPNVGEEAKEHAQEMINELTK